MARGVCSFLTVCVEESWLPANTVACWLIPQVEHTVIFGLTEEQMAPWHRQTGQTIAFTTAPV